MKTSEFNYELPRELIATHPARPRDAARLLMLDRDSGRTADKHFFDLPDLVQAGDVLVFNDSKVIPARLQAKIGERDFEILLVKNVEGTLWECWLRPGRKAKSGDQLIFSNSLTATLVSRREDIFFLRFNLEGTDFYREIENLGEMPVPPYILKARESASCHSEQSEESRPRSFVSLRMTERGLDSCLPSSQELRRTSRGNDRGVADENDYQTVYAKNEGSVAAPTAGLHFTDDLLQRLREKGVQLEYVTLHVGLGTFQPLNTENVEDFRIHSEFYEISQETAARLNAAKEEGRRIIAVGTTSVRVLESAANDDTNKYLINAGAAETQIYIYPGYAFKFVDGMITNFHLPDSSLLLLVAAFAGKESILAAYDHAIRHKYKFYSYGDGMVII